MTPLFVMVLPVILLFCGLALDVSSLELKTVQMQTAADSAAIAAELELERDAQGQTGGIYNYVTSAQADATLNGFTNGVNGVTVSVTNPPVYGEYAGMYDATQVTITQTVHTLFMGILSGSGTRTLSAYATSLEPPCNFAMNTHHVNTAITLFESNISSTCPLYSGGGLTVDSTSWLNATAFNVTAFASQSADYGKTTPTPRYGATAIPDPLAAVSAPSFVQCNYTNWKATTSNSTGTDGLGLPKYALSPGTYCGGINVNTVELDFAPGLYIITGGMSFGTDTFAVGSGVTFYFTNGGGFSYGSVNMSGNSSVLLSAGTTSSNGSIPGILYFFDRNFTPTLPALYAFTCNDAFLVGDGIYYSINSGFNFTSCSNNPTNYFGVVTDTLTFDFMVPQDNFGLTFYSNYSALPGGNPFRTQSVLVQ
jgi:hypothetical protein